MQTNLRIDGERLWRSLTAMAEIGATARGGVRRLALSDEDRAGRDLFVRWCREAGLAVEVDPMGNLFARRAGRDPDRPAVLMGSHLDSQPTGGRFDGVYGVLAALEVVRTLNERGVETDAPLEIVSWTNEEGARFAPAMLGSGVYAGVFDLDYGHGRTDAEGATVGAELARIGYRGDAPLGGRSFTAYLEPHIEQGPILEAEGATVGVVTRGQGTAWYDVEVVGAEAHAGSTPIEMRRDALVGAAEMVGAVRAIATERAPDGRSTVGEFGIEPGSRNTIPGRVRFTVDLRHPERAVMQAMAAELRARVAAIAAAHRLEADVREVWFSPPVAFDPELVAAVRAGAERCGYRHRDIVSGAGHDAFYLSRVCPTAMIFVPCKDGLSHNEAESAEPGDLEAGCNVLLQAALARAID